MRTFESVADLAAAQGQTIGQSPWVTITQEDVNLFADATSQAIDDVVDHRSARRRPGHEVSKRVVGVCDGRLARPRSGQALAALLVRECQRVAARRALHQSVLRVDVACA